MITYDDQVSVNAKLMKDEEKNLHIYVLGRI